MGVPTRKYDLSGIDGKTGNVVHHRVTATSIGHAAEKFLRRHPGSRIMSTSRRLSGGAPWRENAMKQSPTLGQMKAPGGETFLWLLFGGVAGLGLWWLLRPKAKPAPGVTQAAPMPGPLPTEYASLAAVATAFDDLKTLYRSGRKTPPQAAMDAENLARAVTDLQAAGADPAQSQELFRQLSVFHEDVLEFMEMQGTPAA